jgi:serine/threonine protein kinase
MAEALACPECGTDLPADAPEGLCPACLLHSGLVNAGMFAPRPSTMTPLPGPFVAPEPAELAKHFPQLEILVLLGQGGMGAVYKARQMKLDRLVALKILPPTWGQDPAFAERFTREARALARLSHPNIVSIHDFGESGGLFYFIMEFVDGASLRQVLLEGRLTPAESLKIVPQLCDALQYAHDEGLVHRDIKPENILLDRRGRVKIADFGLAKLVGTAPAQYTLTGSRQVMGTPHYMAPEQMEKPQTVDHRADIYSLGVVFYEMLTGELPLGRFAPPSHKAAVDGRLDDIVLRALAKEPRERYQKISELKADVDGSAGGAAASPVRRSASGLPPLSFMASDNWFGQALGLIHLEDDALLFEYQTTYFGFFSTNRHNVQEKRLPLRELVKFELKKCWGQTTLNLSGKRLTTLGDIPSSRMGQLHLTVNFADRPIAEELVREIHARLGYSLAAAGAVPSKLEAAMVQVRMARLAMGLYIVAAVALGFWLVVDLIVLIEASQPHRPRGYLPAEVVFMGFLWNLVVLGLCFLMVNGARKLRRSENYRQCVIAALAAMLPFSPHVMLGLPVGIMILLALRRPEVKQAFQLKARGLQLPAPMHVAPPPTGFLRRKAQSIMRGFGTLFFDSYAAPADGEPDPRHIPTAPAPAAAATPPPSAERPTSPPAIPSGITERRSHPLITLLIVVGIIALILVIIALTIFLYAVRENYREPPSAKLMTTAPVAPSRKPVRTLDPDRAIEDFLRPLNLNQERWQEARKAMKESFQEYLALEKKHTQARVDEQTGRLQVNINAFDSDRYRFEDDFWKRLDPLLTEEQQKIGRRDNIKQFQALFPNIVANTLVQIWMMGNWYHWTFSRKGTHGNITDVSDSGQDVKLPADLKRFWAMREQADKPPNDKPAQPGSDKKR